MQHDHGSLHSVTLPLGRRQLVLACAAIAGAGCGTTGRDGSSVLSGPESSPADCSGRGVGPGLAYCLVDAGLLRVPHGAKLDLGHAVLVTRDDDNAAILVRDSGGLYALSAICTHQCCLVTICRDADCRTQTTNPGACAVSAAAPLAPSGAVFLCPCHGSAFAANGDVLGGPAKVPLHAIAVRVDGDDAVIDLSTEVGHDVRA